MPSAHHTSTPQFHRMESVTPHRLSFDAMSLEEAATGFAQDNVSNESQVEHTNLDGRVNSQTIHPTTIQTPPVLKRKRRPSTVKAPREQTRDVLWIAEPPLLPSDLDWNDDSNDTESTTLASLQSASVASSYNPFININNRRTRDAEEHSQNVGPAMLPIRRTTMSYLGFPNIPSLDTPETPKALVNPQSTMPSMPSVSIFGNSKGPLKMRRLNSLG